MQRVAKRKPGYMLPVVLDGTIVPEVEGIVWLDKTLTPEQLAARLVAKIQEPPPKPWWFYVSTEVKIAIGAVLLALILFGRQAVNYFRPSRTAVTSPRVHADGVTAHFVNSGPKSATLVGQRLMFGTVPLVDQVLRLDKPATIPPGERDVKLLAREILAKCNADDVRHDRAKVEEYLDQRLVTLVIDIRESDDAPGHSTRRSVTFPAARLKPLVGKAVSRDGSDTDC